MSHLSMKELTYTSPIINVVDSKFIKLVKSAIIKMDKQIDSNPHNVTNYTRGVWYGFNEVLNRVKSGKGVNFEYLEDWKNFYDNESKMIYDSIKKKGENVNEYAKSMILWDVDMYKGKADAFNTMIGWI